MTSAITSNYWVLGLMNGISKTNKQFLIGPNYVLDGRRSGGEFWPWAQFSFLETVKRLL